MPFFVWYMAACALAAAFWWRRDRARAKGLLGVMAALPVAYALYNGLAHEAATHGMIMLWLVVPALLYFQGLMRLLPAILGEFIWLPYLLHALGWLDAHAALWWGDFFGLSMLLMQMMGQGIGRYIADGIAHAASPAGKPNMAAHRGRAVPSAEEKWRI